MYTHIRHARVREQTRCCVLNTLTNARDLGSNKDVAEDASWPVLCWLLSSLPFLLSILMHSTFAIKGNSYCSAHKTPSSELFNCSVKFKLLAASPITNGCFCGKLGTRRELRNVRIDGVSAHLAALYHTFGGTRCESSHDTWPTLSSRCGAFPSF